jgi:hypothetical protein
MHCCISVNNIIRSGVKKYKDEASLVVRINNPGLKAGVIAPGRDPGIYYALL